MLTRHEFLRSVLMTGLGATVLAACGSDGEPDPPNVDAAPPDAFAGTCATNSVAIGANHGHEMTVDAADVEAATSKMYDITGVADHGHSVTITASQFATLKTEGSLTVMSTVNGHSHSIRVRCTT